MKLNVVRESEQAVLSPEGDIDLNVSPEFQQALRQVIGGKPGRLVVDLTQVPYMDSSGVATLVDALQQTRRFGGSLVLCGLQPKVRSIFEITRLEAVFTIVKSVEEARSV